MATANFFGSDTLDKTTITLSSVARAFRAGHACIAVGFLLAIVYVWWSALNGRRDPLWRAAVLALVSEGILVVVNRGDCPLGGLQERLGDPVPLFELVLPPTAARRAVPVLGVVTAIGLALLAAAPRAATADKRRFRRARRSDGGAVEARQVRSPERPFPR